MGGKGKGNQCGKSLPQGWVLWMNSSGLQQAEIYESGKKKGLDLMCSLLVAYLWFYLIFSFRKVQTINKAALSICNSYHMGES